MREGPFWKPPVRGAPVKSPLALVGPRRPRTPGLPDFLPLILRRDAADRGFAGWRARLSSSFTYNCSYVVSFDVHFWFLNSWPDKIVIHPSFWFWILGDPHLSFDVKCLFLVCAFHAFSCTIIWRYHNLLTLWILSVVEQKLSKVTDVSKMGLILFCGKLQTFAKVSKGR